MANAKLREAAPEAHLADVQRRAGLIENLKTQRHTLAAKIEIDRHRPRTLSKDHYKASPAKKHAMLRQAIDSVYV